VIAEEVRRNARAALNEFVNCIREIEDIRSELARLESLIRTREISEKVADSLSEEQKKKLLRLAESFFSLRYKLDDARARVFLELEKARVTLERTRMKAGSSAMTGYGASEVSSEISRLEKLLDEINRANESLDIDAKLFIVKNYISAVIAENVSMTQEEMGGRRKVCSAFLDGVFKEWSQKKDEMLKQISDFDSSISELRSAVKENWIRYTVGEYDKKTYEVKRDEIEGKISSIEKQSSNLKAYVEEVDSKISECLRLLREN